MSAPGRPILIAIAAGALAAIVFWVYLPSLNGSFLFYDENAFILRNAHVNTGFHWAGVAWAFQSLEYANWYPVTWLSHMLDVQLYGLNPWGHHLTNVLFHALNTVLVFLVLGRLTGRYGCSLAVAAFFGLHPLRVESVAWISERKDVLSTFFWLLAMGAYANYAIEKKDARPRTRLYYGLTLLCFALGMMSKTMVVTLPFVLLLLDYWPLERKQPWRTLAIEKLPFFLLTIAASIVEYLAQQNAGALQEMGPLSLGDRIANALVSYVRYAGKFFYPADLCILYPHPGHWPMVLVLASAAVVGGVSIMAWRHRRSAPFLFVGWFWFIGTFIPVINLVQLGSQSIADRYTYVPMIGFSLLLVWGIAAFSRRWQYGSATAAGLAVGIAATWVVWTRHEIGYWNNDVIIWVRALAVTKNNYVAHNNLGILARNVRPDIAFNHFQQAVSINPHFADAQRNLADQFNLQGHYDEAIPHYQASLQIDPMSGVAEGGLGAAFYNKGRLDEALAHLTRAVELDPNSGDFQNNLGAALLDKHRPADALPHFQKAVALVPDNPIYWNGLGVACSMDGRPNDAIKAFQEALRLEPDYDGAKRNLEHVMTSGSTIPTFPHPGR